MRIEYFDINANNINDITSIYVKDENKEDITKLLASNFTKSLLELDLTDCFYLKGILPISKCINLKKLKITEANVKINNIFKCTNLEELILKPKSRFNMDLSQLNIFNKIKYIELNNIVISIDEFLKTDTYLELPNLHSLIFNNMIIDEFNNMIIDEKENLYDISNIFKILSRCINLKIITIEFYVYIYNIDNLNFIDKLINLEELELINWNIRDISNLSNLCKLKKFRINKLNYKSLDINKYIKLNELYISSYNTRLCSTVTILNINLHEINIFNNVTHIELYNVSINIFNLINDKYLELPNLYSLIISNITDTSDIYNNYDIYNILSHCVNLKILELHFYKLYNDDTLNNIDKLINLEKLQLLNYKFNNISNLLKLNKLSSLTFSKRNTDLILDRIKINTLIFSKNIKINIV